MAGPDATASAALAAPLLHPCWALWLDIQGDPVRITSAPYDVPFTGTGDVDLDGFDFEATLPGLISISDVLHADDGSGTVTVTLSGLAVIDADILAAVDDRSRWRGREAAIWLMLYDVNLKRIGNVWRYYSGTMATAPHKGGADGASIELTIEGYRNSLSNPPGRTYLMQRRYDPDDASADAAIAGANGGSGAALANSYGAIGSGGTGSAFDALSNRLNLV